MSYDCLMPCHIRKLRYVITFVHDCEKKKYTLIKRMVIIIMFIRIIIFFSSFLNCFLNKRKYVYLVIHKTIKGMTILTRL